MEAKSITAEFLYIYILNYLIELSQIKLLIKLIKTEGNTYNSIPRIMLFIFMQIKF